MDPKIIKLAPLRWEEYKHLRLEALEKHPVAFSPSFEDYLTRDDRYWQDKVAEFNKAQSESMWFIEVEGKLVGMAGWYRSLSPKIRHKATIFGVYLQPEFQGKGLAKELLNKVIKELDSISEIVKIDLNVGVKNQKALKLYQSLGFEIVGTLQKEVYVDGIYYDEYGMERLVK